MMLVVKNIQIETRKVKSTNNTYGSQELKHNLKHIQSRCQLFRPAKKDENLRRKNSRVR